MATAEAPPHNPTRAVMASGALFTDSAGRVMLVKPTYKSFWDIPGGYVEFGESPADACAREVKEELGIQPAIGPLLIADWAPTEQEGDKLLFIFDGGKLTEDQLSSISIQRSELTRFEFVPQDHLTEYTIDRLVRRISAALTAKRNGLFAYLENGSESAPTYLSNDE